MSRSFKTLSKRFYGWITRFDGPFAFLLVVGSLVVLDLFLKLPLFNSMSVHESEHDWKDLPLAIVFGLALVWWVWRIKREEEETAFLASIVRSSLDAIIGFTNEGVITGWNRGAEQIFGYNASEMTGKSFTDYIQAMVPETLREESLERFEHMRKSSDVIRVETLRLCKDGRQIQVLMTLTPICDKRGKVIGQGGVIRDITEFKKAEEACRAQEAQLRVTQKVEAIGQLAGGVAHDFNNLLVVVRGNSESLLEGTYSSGPGHEELLEIQEAARRGSELTRQLLAFSNKQTAQPESLNLNELAVGMNNMLHRLIYDHIEMYLFQGKDLGHILGDPTQVEQIILNLVINARDAMPNGGHLLIETQNVVRGSARDGGAVPEGNYVRLSVKDTGCGMDEAVRRRIFDPFFTTKGEGGTGLGLATVQKIVQRMGGYIVVQSEPGVGTEFSIYFPVCPAPPAVRTALSCLPLETKGTETVLIAEDDPAVRKILVRILRGTGYRTLEAGNGEEAIRVAGDHEGVIDLLLTDVLMPKMGGRDLAEALVTMRPGTKVLFISGYPSDVLSSPVGAMDRMPLLFKPFSPAALTEKIRGILDGTKV